eukprot:5067745-Amphidinium_carterae.2
MLPAQVPTFTSEAATEASTDDPVAETESSRRQVERQQSVRHGITLCSKTTALTSHYRRHCQANSPSFVVLLFIKTNRLQLGM